MAFGLEELADKVRKVPSLITAKTADKLKPLFKQEVLDAVDFFYGSYEPEMYTRTENLKYNAYSDSDWHFSGGDNAEITITMNGDAMSDYPSLWDDGAMYSGVKVFENAYVGGNHGEGILNMGHTIPPHKHVLLYVNSGFKGQVEQKLIESADEVIGSLL